MDFRDKILALQLRDDIKRVESKVSQNAKDVNLYCQKLEHDLLKMERQLSELKDEAIAKDAMLQSVLNMCKTLQADAAVQKDKYDKLENMIMHAGHLNDTYLADSSLAADERNEARQRILERDAQQRRNSVETSPTSSPTINGPPQASRMQHAVNRESDENGGGQPPQHQRSSPSLPFRQQDLHMQQLLKSRQQYEGDEGGEEFETASGHIRQHIRKPLASIADTSGSAQKDQENQAPNTEPFNDLHTFIASRNKPPQKNTGGNNQIDDSDSVEQPEGTIDRVGVKRKFVEVLPHRKNDGPLSKKTKPANIIPSMVSSRLAQHRPVTRSKAETGVAIPEHLPKTSVAVMQPAKTAISKLPKLNQGKHTFSAYYHIADKAFAAYPKKSSEDQYEFVNHFLKGIYLANDRKRAVEKLTAREDSMMKSGKSWITCNWERVLGAMESAKLM